MLTRSGIYAYTAPAPAPAGFAGNDRVAISSVTGTPATVSFTGTVTLITSITGSLNTNFRITGVSSVAGLKPGMLISDSNGRIQANTTITRFDPNGMVVSISRPILSSGAVNCTAGGSPILMSRKSGRIPMFVHVTAGDFASVGTDDTGQPVLPAEDIEWTWDFGDPTGTRFVTDPRTGLQRNANSEQIGHQAAYCYDTVGTGTYTITVTGRYWTGSAFNTVSASTTVEVLPYTPTHEIWVDSNAPGPTFSGTLANPYNTIAQLNSALFTFSADWRINFARGSNFTDANINIPNFASGWRLQPYGTGAAPIISSASSGSVINGGNAGGNYIKNDVVMQGLVFTNLPGATHSNILNNTGGATNAITMDHYWDGCVFHNTQNVANSQLGIGGAGVNEVGNNRGMWNCQIIGDIFECQFQGQITSSGILTVTSIQTGALVVGMVVTTPTITFSSNLKILSPNTVNPDGTGTYNITAHAATSGVEAWFAGGQGGHGRFGSASYFDFSVGCSYSGPDTIGDVTFIHHVYPECYSHQYWKWCNFGKTGSRGINGCQRVYSLNINLQGQMEGLNADFHLISENVFGVAPDATGQGSTRLVHDGSDVNNSAYASQAFANFVTERNFITSMTQAGAIANNSILSFTMRDNRITNYQPGEVLSVSGAIGGVYRGRVYRNSMYFLSNNSNQMVQWGAETWATTNGPTFTGTDGVNPCEISGVTGFLPVGSAFFFTGTVPSGVSTGRSNHYWIVPGSAYFGSGSTFGSPGQNTVSGTTLTVMGVAIATMSWSGGIVTATVSGNGHGLSPGANINIDGVTPSGYNGSYIVSTTPNGTTFTFPLVSDPGGAMSVAGNFVQGVLKPGHSLNAQTIGFGLPQPYVVLSQLTTASSTGVSGRQGTYQMAQSVSTATVFSFIASISWFSATKGGTPITNAGAIITTPQRMDAIVTMPLQFTDNVLLDERASPAALNLASAADFQAAGSYIHSNQYYAPSGNTSWWSDSVVGGLTKAAWQADGFDTDGTFQTSNPSGWTVPPTTWSDFGP